MVRGGMRYWLKFQGWLMKEGKRKSQEWGWALELPPQKSDSAGTEMRPAGGWARWFWERDSKLGSRLGWDVEVTVKPSRRGVEITVFLEEEIERERERIPEVPGLSLRLLPQVRRMGGQKEDCSEGPSFCGAKHRVNTPFIPGCGLTLDTWEEDSFQNISWIYQLSLYVHLTVHPQPQHTILEPCHLQLGNLRNTWNCTFFPLKLQLSPEAGLVYFLFNVTNIRCAAHMHRARDGAMAWNRSCKLQFTSSIWPKAFYRSACVAVVCFAFTLTSCQNT